MKTLKYIFAFIAGIFFIVSCNEGIDPISAPLVADVETTAPSVIISYPGEGALIRVKEAVTSINIQFEVVDDIEIKSISVKMDGTELTSFSDFKDYRRAVEEYLYSNLTNGMHTLTVTGTDLSGKVTTKSVNFEKATPYQPVYNGEIFYMPFDGDNMELVNIITATKIGSPGFGAGKKGSAYTGAADAYLTFPTSSLQLGNAFSTVFWYKLNATPDRSGILTIGPPDGTKTENLNNRKNGFRFFREGSATNQTFKLNVGNGTEDNWFDGGAAASLNPATAGWVHMAFTISNTGCKVYIDGKVVSQGTFKGVDWTGCNILSIASGAPRFTEWGHLSDRSSVDELRIFNKALTQAEIQTIYNAEK